MDISYKKIIAGGVVLIFAFFPLDIFHKNEQEGQFPFCIPWTYCKDSQIDMSFLLDAPAGKHGFVKVKNGHFYFEDGTRARFWGVNIHSNRACFPAHIQAEDIAKRLSQLGCNIVRLHLLDNEGPAGIIDAEYGDSQHLSKEQMDKLDYFIFQLKQNGIYVCFDVLGLGVRRFKAGDNVPDFDKIRAGAGGVSFFNKRIMQLSKKFALDFLSHVNPYTGKSYLEEPCVAMVEMTNENTLFGDWITENFTPYYNEEINRIWQEWLKEKGRTSNDGAINNWRKDREFLFTIQLKHHVDMYGYLRSIGVKVPIGSTNTPHDNLDLAADSFMDFTDIHPYWDLVYRSNIVHNRPLIKQSHFNPYTMINTMSRAKVKGKPLINTEWGSLWPNEYRAVDMLTTTAYAALNDLDALFLYAYNGGWDMSWDNLENKIYYDTVVFNDPAKMGLFPLCALMFLRGDIRPSIQKYTVSYNMKSLFDMTDPHPDRVRLAGIMYVSRLEKDFSEANNADMDLKEIVYPDNLSIVGDKRIVISDTSEILRDFKKGIFKLETPKTFSFSGFVGEEKSCEFKDIDINFLTNVDFATFTITSLDGKDLIVSEHLLLAVIGLAHNKDQRLAPHVTKKIDDLNRDVYILNKGNAPILVNSIDAKIFFKERKKDEVIEVFTLNNYGSRVTRLSIAKELNVYSFETSGKDCTIYYEIIRR